MLSPTSNKTLCETESIDDASGGDHNNSLKITVEDAPQLATSASMLRGRCSATPFNSRSGEYRATFQVLPGTAIHAVEKTGAFIANITEGTLTNPSEARRRVLINVSAVVIEADRNLTEEELSTKAILATINRQLKFIESHKDKINNSSEDLHHVSQMTARNLKTLAESLPTVINVPREHWSIKEDNPQETNSAGACISLELSGAEGLAEVVGLLHIRTEEWERKRLTPLILPEVVAIFYPHLDIFDAVLTTSVNTERSLKRPIVFRMRGTCLQITSPVVEMDASTLTHDTENSRDESYRTSEGEEWSLSLPSQTGGQSSSLRKIVKVSPAPTPMKGKIGVNHFNQHPSIRRVETLRASIDPVGRHKGSGGLPIAIHLPNITRNVVNCRPSRSSCPDGLSSPNVDYYFTGSCRLMTAEGTSGFSDNNYQAQQPKEKQPSPLTSLGGARTLEEVAEMAVKEYSRSKKRTVGWSNNTPIEIPSQREQGAKCLSSTVGGRLAFYYWNHNDICSILLSSPANIGMCLDTRFLLSNNTDKTLGATADPMSTVICAHVKESNDEWTNVVAAAVIHDTGRFSATDLSFSPTIDGDTVRAMVAASSFDNNYNAGMLSHSLVLNSIAGNRNSIGCKNRARSIVVEATMEYGSSLKDAEDYEVWATGFVQALAIAVADHLDLDRRLGNGGEVRPPLVDHFLFPSEELMADRRNGPGIYSWDDPVRAVVELYRWVCETRIRRVSSARVANHRAGDWAAMHTAVLELLLSPCFSAIVASGVWAMQSARDFMAWVVEDVILTSCSSTLAKRSALVLDRSTLDEMGRLALTWVVVLSASQNKGLCVAFSGGKVGPGSFYIEPGRDLARATLSPIPSRLMKEPWRWLTRNRNKRQMTRRRRTVSSNSLPISDAGVAFSLPTSSLSPACYPKNISIVILGPPRQPSAHQRRVALSRGATTSFIDYSPPPALIQDFSRYSDNVDINRGSSFSAIPGFSNERALGNLEANLVSGTTKSNSIIGEKKYNNNPPKLSSNTSPYAKTEANILEHITLSLPCDGTFASSDANLSSASTATSTGNRYVSIINGQNEVVFWDPLLSRQSLIQAADSKSDALPDLNDSDVAEVFLRERLGPILKGKMVFQPSIGAADAASEGFRWLRWQLLADSGIEGLVIEGQTSNITKDLFSQADDIEADSVDGNNNAAAAAAAAAADDDDDDDDDDVDDDNDEKLQHIKLDNVNDSKGCEPDISSGWWRDRGKSTSTESILRTILKTLGPETKDDGTRATNAIGSRSSTAFQKFIGPSRAELILGESSKLTFNSIKDYSSRTINVTDTELFLRQKFPYVLASIIQRLAIVVGKDELGVIHDVCESISNILADSLLIAVNPDITEQMLKSIPGRFGVSISGRDGSLSVLNSNKDTDNVSQSPILKSSTSNYTKESIIKHLESAMVPPPASRLLSTSELVKLASSGGMNNLRRHRRKGQQSHDNIDRSAIHLSSLPHLTSIYVPTNPHKILTDDQWFDVLVRVEAGTRQATVRTTEELEVARDRGEQLAKLALGASEILKTNDTITDEQANWLRRRADNLIPIRDTALKNAAIITNTPKLVAIPSYNLSAVVRTLSDTDYYSVIPNVWLRCNWIDIVTLAVRLALVPLAFTVSRGVVIGNKIAILFNSSSSLIRAEAALNN
nr:MAG: wsv289-like protein [Penaeus semisulcatus pemonivirus]